MQFLKTTLLTCFLALGLFSPPLECQVELTELSEISILTCRPGDDIYNTFGHTAIMVRDPALGKNEIYNYGIFDFKTPGFTMKFLRGKLLYYLGLQRYKTFINAYNYERRSVFEQKLNLNLEDRRNIYSALKENYKPDNRAYLYDFFFDNCSTRPRDLVLNELGNIDIPELNPSRTFRDLIDEYTYGKPWTDFGIDLIVGSIADRNATALEAMFLPEYLYHNFDQITINGTPLVKESKLLADHDKQVAKRSERSWLTPQLIFVLFLMLELFLFLKYKDTHDNRYLNFYDKFWFILGGLGGLLIAFMWFGTDHDATKSNINILILNPLLLLVAFKTKKLIGVFTVGCIITAFIISPFVQYLHPATILIGVVFLLKALRLLGNRH
ncbi:MAG: DUF4105 domain-containing protein [Saprospiraceae bacterium]|nr:DUF4105 domain-containing protein [Saprospiraceae bacterium]